MSQQIPRKDEVWDVLQTKAAPAGFELLEDDQVVMLFYPGPEQPDRRRDERGLSPRRGDDWVGVCRDLLAQDSSMVIDPATYQGRSAWRITGSLRP